MNKRILHGLVSCLIVLIILGVYYVTSNLDGGVVPMNRTWNDEAFYYGQVKAVQKYLHPQGYYGYNDSHALIGGFGAWSPVIIIVYSLLSFPFSFLLNSIWITNLVLIGMSAFLLFECTDADLRSTIIFSTVYLLFYMIRYAYSGMTEALFFGIMAILGGILVTSNKRLRPYAVVLITIIALVRPYYVLLYPLFVYDGGQKRKSLIHVALLSLGCVLGFFLISRCFCAPYLYPVLRVNDVLSLIHGGIGESLFRLYQYMKCNLGNYLEYLHLLPVGDCHAVSETLYFGVGLWLLVSLTKRFTKRRLYLFLCMFILPFASMNLYSVGETYRHILPYITLVMIYLLNDVRYQKENNLQLSVFAIMCICSGYLYFSNPSNKWATMDYTSYNIEKESMRLSDINDNGYENTVAMSWRDDSFHAIYSFPIGFGVSFCDVSYLDTPEEVKSRYVLVEKQGELFSVYEDYSVIFENDTIALYDLKQSE